MKVSKEIWGYNFIWLLILMAGFIFCQSSPLNPLLPESDSAVFITSADIVSDGGIMYKDFFDHKGPLIYLFDLLGLRMGGIAGIWSLCILWSLISANINYALCRIYSSKKSSFIATAFFCAFLLKFGCDNTVELVGLPFICLGLFYLLRALHKKGYLSFVDALAVSFCIAVTFLLKPNICAAVVFCCLWLIIRDIELKRWLEIGKYFLSFVISFCFVGIVTWALLNVFDAWQNYIDTFWKFNMSYSDSLSLSTKLYGGFKLIFLTLFSALSWCFVVFTLIKSYVVKRGFIENLILAIVLLVSSFVACGMSGYIYSHYLIAIIPMFAIFIAKAFDLRKTIADNIIVYSLSGIIVALYGWFIFSQRPTEPIQKRADVQKAINAYIEDNSGKRDMICLYGVDPIYYYTSQRRPASKYIYQWMIFGVSPKTKTEFEDDIRKNKPSLMLVSKSKVKEVPKDIYDEYTVSEVSGTEVLSYIIKQ